MPQQPEFSPFLCAVAASPVSPPLPALPPSLSPPINTSVQQQSSTTDSNHFYRSFTSSSPLSSTTFSTSTSSLSSLPLYLSPTTSLSTAAAAVESAALAASSLICNSGSIERQRQPANKQMTSDDDDHDDDGCGYGFSDGGQEQRRHRRQRHEAMAAFEHRGDLLLLSGAGDGDLTGGTTHRNMPTSPTSLHPQSSSLIRSSSPSSASSSAGNPELCNRSCSSASSYHRHHLHPSHPTSERVPPSTLTVGHQHLLRTPVIIHRQQSPPSSLMLLPHYGDEQEKEEMKKSNGQQQRHTSAAADHQSKQQALEQKRLKTTATAQQSTAVDAAGGTYLAHNRLPPLLFLPPHRQLQEDQKCRRSDQFVVNFGEKQQQQTKWPENGREKKRSSEENCSNKECSKTTVAKIGLLEQQAVADNQQQRLKKSGRTTSTTSPTTGGHFAAATIDTPLKLASGSSNRCRQNQHAAVVHHEDPRNTAAAAAAASASASAVHKPCTSRRRSQLTSDIDEKKTANVNNAPQTTTSLQKQNNIFLTDDQQNYSRQSQSQSSCLDSSRFTSAGDHLHQLTTTTTRAESISSSTGRSSDPHSKTANPAVLRAKLCSARFAAESAARGSSYLLQEEDEDATSSTSSSASDEEAEATESLLPAQTSRRSSSGHATSFTSSVSVLPSHHHQQPSTITNHTSSHSSSSSGLRNSGIVSWTELRNKLIRLQRKAASQQQKGYYKARYSNKRVSTSSFSSISKTSTTSRTSTALFPSSGCSGKHRQIINRNLLAEFRRRFRPASGGSRNCSSLLYFDNPVSATNNKAVNYSYSYYNFFYYPPKQQQEEKSLSTVATIDHQLVPTAQTLVRHGCETERNLQRNSQHFHPHQLRPPFPHHHHYHHLHHPHLAATTSLTSLLSTTSSTTSSSTSPPPVPTTSSLESPACCNQHNYYHCNLESAAVISPTERNLLLPHSVSAEPIGSKFSQHQFNNFRRFGHHLPHHHYHHHHLHRNSFCTGLLEKGDSAKGLRPFDAGSTTGSIAAASEHSGGFHPHSHSSSAEEEASTASNGCLSTIMEILPLLLLLTMGVIISTTCAKYTFHSSSTPTSSVAASSAAAYSHHRFSGLNSQSSPSAYDQESPKTHHLRQDTRSSSGDGGGDNRPEPPYLMMMQNDDEFSRTSNSETAAASSPDTSVESYDASEAIGSKAVDEFMKKSSPGGPNGHHNYNHYHQKMSSSDHHQTAQVNNSSNSPNQQSMLAQLAHQYAAMQLKWVANASAACNDGTRAGYYIRRHASSRRWLIYLEGGWYCMSKTTCEHRWAKMRELMTSFRWTQFKTFNGILSASPTVNPYLWDANHVFIPYCSSDIWSGSATGARGEMSFLGSRIIDEVIRTLLNTPSYQFGDAKFVLLAGSSAGAAGVMINLDRVAQQIANAGSKADVRGLADSGWVLESDFIEKMINRGGGSAGDNGQFNKGFNNKSPHHQGRAPKVPPPALQPPPCTDAEKCSPGDSIQGAYKLWNSRVPEACMERYRDEPWRCFYGYRLYPTLKTPLFVVQFQYDEFQIHVDGIANGAKWGEVEKVQYFRLISQALRGTLSPLSAVFAPACMSHIILTRPDWHKVAVKGVTLPEALRCWEETPMAVVPSTQQYIGGGTTRYTPDALTFLQQHFPSLYQTYKNSLVNGGGYNSKNPSAKIAFNAMYPYGMPVVTTSEGGGSAHSGEQIDLAETTSAEDELSQYYSSGNRQMTFNYGTQGGGAGAGNSGIPVKSASSSSGGNGNSANNHYLQEEIMAGDDPRSVAGSRSPSEQMMKPTTTDDENGNNIVVITSSSTTSRPHGHRSSSSISSSGHHGHSHSHGNNRQTNKQEKKRKKRKRRKHMQRRTTTTTSTTPSPMMLMYSSTTSVTSTSSSVISHYKPRRQMVVTAGQQLEDNNIKVNQNQQYQNDGTFTSTSHHHHPYQSRSKKHNRPSRMYSPFDFVVPQQQQHQQQQFGGDQWSSMSGGDDAVTDTFYASNVTKNLPHSSVLPPAAAAAPGERSAAGVGASWPGGPDGGPYNLTSPRRRSSRIEEDDVPDCHLSHTLDDEQLRRAANVITTAAITNVTTNYSKATNSTSALLLMNNSSSSYRNFNQLWPKSAIRRLANRTTTTMNNIIATTSTFSKVVQKKLKEEGEVNDLRLSTSEAGLRLPPFSVHHQPVASEGGRKTDTASHSAFLPTASGNGKSVADEGQGKAGRLQSHRFQLSALSQSPTSSGQVDAAGSVFAASDFSATSNRNDAFATMSAIASTGRSLFSSSSSTIAAVNDLAINFTITSNASLATAAVAPAPTDDSFSYSYSSHSAHRPSALSSPSNNNNQRIAESSASSGLQSGVEPRGPEDSVGVKQFSSSSSSSASFSTSPGQPYYYNLPLADYYYFYANSKQTGRNTLQINALITPTGDSADTTSTTTSSNSTAFTNELYKNSSSKRGSEVTAAVLPTPSFSSGTSLPTISSTSAGGEVRAGASGGGQDDEDSYEVGVNRGDASFDDDYEQRIDQRKSALRPSFSSNSNAGSVNELLDNETEGKRRQQQLVSSLSNEKSNQRSNAESFGSGSSVSSSLRSRRNRLRAKTKKSIASKSSPANSAASSTAQQPVYEVFINEEDKDLPKKLFQVKALMINDLSRGKSIGAKSSTAAPSPPSSGLMFILSGNGVDYEHPEQSKFAINAFTGELFLIAPVDRDPPTGRDVWRLNITAEDERGERVNGSVLVLVRVRDINDNAPYFERELYHANVSENMSAGVDVIRLSAIDRDVDSIVRYSIEVNRVNSEGELIFDIDELSGVVSTAVCCLDRESIDSFTIKVCATDEAISGDSGFHWSTGKASGSGKSSGNGGKATASMKSPPSSASTANQTNSCTSVVIDITDENDESPRFVRDKYFLLLSDGVNELYPGRIFLNTTVTDADLPETNRFACRLAGAIRFPSLTSSTTTTKNHHDQQNNDTNSVVPVGMFTQPMGIHLRKYFSCEVNATNGNVRLLVVENPGVYDPEKFYRSLVTEFETYRQSVSAAPSVLPETVELQFKITITDVGVFEVTSADEQPIEQRLTSADLSAKFATVKPQMIVGGLGTATSSSNGTGGIGGLQPSLAVVVTKQISPNGYNSESNGGIDLLGQLRSKWQLLVVNGKNGSSGTLFLVGSALLMVIGCTIAVLLLVFRSRSRRRSGNGGIRKRSSFQRRSTDSIPGAICCMNAVNGAGDGSSSLPITSNEEHSNGTNGTTITSEHQFGGICSSYSALEGEMAAVVQSSSADHHHNLGGHSGTMHHQSKQQHPPSLYHHHHQYSQLAEQLSASCTPESFNCHSSAANSSTNNSTSGRTNTGSSILSDTNYLMDAYRAKSSPSTLDGSTDTSNGPHLVLLESNESHHHHHHQHQLGSSHSHHHHQHDHSNSSSHHNHHQQQYSDQLTTYGFEINAPYDTIALYDLTHLQTIPFDSSANETTEISSSKSTTAALEQLEMSQLRSSTVDLAAIFSGSNHHQTNNNEAELSGASAVVLSPTTGNPVMPDVISKNSQSLCDTTGNFLLINTNGEGGGSSSHRHQMLNSPIVQRNGGHGKV